MLQILQTVQIPILRCLVVLIVVFITNNSKCVHFILLHVFILFSLESQMDHKEKTATGPHMIWIMNNVRAQQWDWLPTGQVWKTHHYQFIAKCDRMSNLMMNEWTWVCFSTRIMILNQIVSLFFLHTNPIQMFYFLYCHQIQHHTTVLDSTKLDHLNCCSYVLP